MKPPGTSGISFLQKIYSNAVSLEPLSSLDWKSLSLTIPFDIPSVAIYNRVYMHTQFKSDTPLRIGECVDAELRIQTFFKWASAPERRKLENEDPQRMLYHVYSKADDWLISGRAKGEFVATDEGSVTVPLMLIPLRRGKLFLPAVSVYPIPDDTTQDHPQFNQGPPSYETDYENAAVSVDVIGGAQQRAQMWINT